MTWNGRLSFVEFDAQSACETIASLQVEADAADAHCQAERARFLRAVAEGIERKPHTVQSASDRPAVSAIHSTSEPTESALTRWTRLRRSANALRAIARKNHRAPVTHPSVPSLRLVSSSSTPNPAAVRSATTSNPAAFRYHRGVR